MSLQARGRGRTLIFREIRVDSLHRAIQPGRNSMSATAVSLPKRLLDDLPDRQSIAREQWIQVRDCGEERNWEGKMGGRSYTKESTFVVNTERFLMVRETRT